MSFLDLFRPKWKHSDSIVRVRAVERLTAQGLLCRIAHEDPWIGVRAAAVRRIFDQDALSEFARDRHPDIREAAVRNLDDQSLLAAIFRADDVIQVRHAALKGLTDQAALSEIALTSSDGYARKVAVERLSDGVALARIVKSRGDAVTRLAAVRKLTDPVILEELARNEGEELVSIRICAARRLPADHPSRSISERLVSQCRHSWPVDAKSWDMASHFGGWPGCAVCDQDYIDWIDCRNVDRSRCDLRLVMKGRHAELLRFLRSTHEKSNYSFTPFTHYFQLEDLPTAFIATNGNAVLRAWAWPFGRILGWHLWWRGGVSEMRASQPLWKDNMEPRWQLIGFASAQEDMWMS
jgi:hypothetical protein